MNLSDLIYVVLIAIAVIVGISMIVLSFHRIGATEVGLVNKKYSFKKLTDDNPIAFNGEAGYQADLLMPGFRFKFWPVFSVEKYPWVQVAAGRIGVVIAQVGKPLPVGAKSAEYKPSFGSFSDVRTFVADGGQKGVQRSVLAPGALLPVHPVGFLIITAQEVYGLPVSPDLQALASRDGVLMPESFGLRREQLSVVTIQPHGDVDVVGIVTVLEGDPLPSGDIASRLGGFEDVAATELDPATTDAQLIEMLLGAKNHLHNNYQDFQAFLDHGGKIGLQHDPLMYGSFLLNPFLVQVELVPMLVVNQGQVAVIKSYVGQPTTDTSGVEFKFGSIVRPGHRGIWQEPLRTGKYPINPRIYAAEIVPTAILTLNWATATSQAHNLDAQLTSIAGKSREGFIFNIDLQVQIHVPDTKAPKVISMVGTMLNLVNEVLQSAVGNYFRNTLQDLQAIRFIETRTQVQEAAFEVVREYLSRYEVETKGVYIQDVIFPDELVEVLTQREIANQEKATFQAQQVAQTARVETEKARGTAEMQAALAQAQVGVDIRRSEADAKKAQAEGDAAFVRMTGEAEAARTEAIGLAEAKAAEALGLARAAGFEAQKEALGEGATALVAAVNAIAEGQIDIMPEVLVTGGGAAEGLMATLMNMFRGNGNGDAAKELLTASTAPAEPAKKGRAPQA
jgi:uncharacterized membrane protein YqiK